MTETIFIFAATLSSVFAFYFLTKNTSLRLDLKNGYVWSIQLYRELFMVSTGVLLATVYGVGAFEGAILNARDEDTLKIGLLTAYAIFGFSISFSLLARQFPVPSGRDSVKTMIHDKRLQRFANAAFASGLSLLFFALFFMSYKHAFISSILTGEPLVAIRLRNSYKSNLPSQLAYVITISWWIVSIYVGVLIYRNKRFKSAIYLFGALFLASAAGNKASVLMCFLIMAFSYSSVRGLRLSGILISKVFFIYIPFVYFLLYLIVSLQIPELKFDKFNVYMLNRLGVGQMSGVFETFSIPRLDGDFFWHVIPGASFFVEYIPYDKMLMMATEGYGFSEMGVKNSFFISEAYGIGGTLLLIFAPFIVGACYALGIRLLNNFLYIFFGRSVATFFTLPLYIFSSSLTGGFSSFPLFKGLSLLIICLVFIWLFFQILRFSFVKFFFIKRYV